MEYDPRAPFGHQAGGPQGPSPPVPPGQGPPPPPRPLTFGGVFWACFLALMVWSLVFWFMVSAAVEESSGF